MLKILLYSPLFLLNITLYAQTDICTGKAYSEYSKVMNENRIIWINLPKSYPDSLQKNYPVIWLLDGDLFFHSLVAIQQNLTGGRQPIMPESIIIGILNTDRTRDLTPTSSAYHRDGNKHETNKEEGGKSEIFSEYLCSELRSEINKKYRTNGQNILIGHSFGGLFVLHTLLNHSEYFNAYIALDPSFW